MVKRDANGAYSVEEPVEALDSVAEGSNTPTSKGVVVRLERAGAESD